MANNVSLKSLFESSKNKLEQQLAQLELPQDANKIQQIIADFLNELCDSDGAFRQSLTQSEDYILQAAMSLHNAQEELYNVLIKQGFTSSRTEAEPESDNISKSRKAPSEGSKQNILNMNVTSTQAMIGSAGGAIVGKLLFSGWGAVIGAIAGTASALYLASREQKTDVSKSPKKDAHSKKDAQIEVSELVAIISGICESVDRLIDTFRAQINRVVNKYESQEKPTLEMNYRSLLENIQLLIGYSRTHGEEEKFVKKIRERVDDLADTLENYQLIMVDYTEEHPDWFERVPSSNATEPRMVYPAIVKDNEVVLKGKIFVPHS